MAALNRLNVLSSALHRNERKAGAEPTAGKPKMVVDSIATGAREQAARKRLAKAGYVVPASTEVQSVHCEKHNFGWLGCGFLQCYTQVDGVRCRVIDYAPHQTLQPHNHDADELFHVRGGRIKAFKWASEEALLSGAAPSSAGWVEAGGVLSVPAGACHCIYTDIGCAFHEVVGDFQTRSTRFLYDGTNGKLVCGADGELRLISKETCKAFGGKAVAITGCSRGLGLEFVHQLCAAGARVAATCRTPARAQMLQAAIGHGPAKSVILSCDVDSEDSIQGCATALRAELAGTPLDVLINNAGISTPNHPVDPILSTPARDMKAVLHTNVVGTVLLTQSILPLMRGGGDKRIVNLSSQLASIANTFGAQGRFGGVACYRMSRAANNMSARTFAGELSKDGFTVVAMSPGHVATDMGSAGGRKAPLTPGESIAGMLKVVGGLDTTQNGRFLQYDGTELPW